MKDSSLSISNVTILYHSPLHYLGSMKLSFLLFPLILLLSTTSSLHVFPSHSTCHVTTRQTFSLVMEGDDCPYTPTCYYKVLLNGTVHSTGVYQNALKSVPVSVLSPGEVCARVEWKFIPK